MNKGLIKFFLDIGPLLIFFYFYKKHGMSYAILPLIIATIISVFFVYRIDKKIPTIPILGAVVVTLFGGLTIFFDNKIFFYMKPTIINIIFAVILLYGQIFLKQPLLKKLFDGSIKISDEGWNILNKRWIYFFIFLAILNELVWRTQSEDFWVQFKVFGLLPITTQSDAPCHLFGGRVDHVQRLGRRRFHPLTIDVEFRVIAHDISSPGPSWTCCSTAQA
jgi:intracellular septation protein